jgi:hypothetical protein
MSKKSIIFVAVLAGVCVLGFARLSIHRNAYAAEDPQIANAEKLIHEGRQTFRFDTFGDETFWGGTLGLHEAVEGKAFGGIGPGLTPGDALAVGLKVDIDALLPALKSGMMLHQPLGAGRTVLSHADLNDASITLALLRSKAVVGLTGVFNSSGGLQSIGIQCALCHSTVDNSVAPGIGRRLDGWANRDLNVGAIVSLAPNLQPVADLLGVNVATVRQVLNAWGPGKFDAELFLDGKGFRPDGKSAAVLIPPAFGLAGVNLHTWTGWGSVPHWNAFVANLEMHGKGRFFDPRLNNTTQFPIAAANGFADLPHINPDDDLITKKLAALQFYQLSIGAPPPRAGRDFDPGAAKRGDELFSGKAKCNNCHVEPLWTEPGWNLHPGSDVCIDDFQANRAPDHSYRTSPLAGIFTHRKGGFYHDGRFPTLHDVVNHYNSCMNLGLTEHEKNDLVQYVLSL